MTDCEYNDDKELRNHLELYKPAVLFVAHGESSTGLLQNLEGFGDLCREFNCLFMVDSVITLGCVPFYVDKWKIDVAYSGSQKILNAPPGITPITFNCCHLCGELLRCNTELFPSSPLNRRKI